MKDYWSLRWLLHFKSLRLILHIQPFSKKAARLGYCLIMNSLVLRVKLFIEKPLSF